MKLTANKYPAARVYDVRGFVIDNLKSYDTKTKIGELYVTARSPFTKLRAVKAPAVKLDRSKKKSSYGPYKSIVVRVKLPDSYAMINGKRMR